MADLRRRSREHALLAARSDQRHQLQQAAAGVPLQDREPRPAPRVPVPGHAADGERHGCTSPPARAAPRWRSTRPPARCCGCTASNEGKRGEAAPRQLSGRGLSYWSDGKEERIIYVTPGYQMVALDAKTGQRVPSFGTDGIVDLKLDLDQEDRPDRPARSACTPRRSSSKDIIVIGAAHREGGAPRSKTNARATSAASTCAPASACGSSTPSR